MLDHLSATLDLLEDVFAADWVLDLTRANRVPDHLPRYEGMTGWRTFFSIWREQFDEVSWEWQAYYDVGDHVVVTGRHRFIGKLSRVPVEEPLGVIYTLRDGLITRLQMFNGAADEALKAVGLEEQAMPDESTAPDLEETARRSIEASNRGDLDAWLAMWAPDAVWVLDPGGIGLVEGRGSVVGHEALRKFAEEMMAAFEDFEIAIEEAHDLGNGVTFAVYVQRGRPSGSGGFVETRVGAVAIWTDGLIERLTTYHKDVDQARAAAEQLAQERG